MTPYYDDGVVTIYHGDCREIDAWLTADVLVTDPPYGMAHRSGMRGAFGTCSVAGDVDSGVRDQVLTLWGARPALVFGRWSVAKPSATRTVLIWDKGDALGMGALDLPWKPTTEEIYVLGHGFVGRRNGSVLHFQGIGPYQQTHGTRYHPTQKPENLMRALIIKCPPAGAITDPFMGSGSTLRAAKDLGRRAIGVELDERYCEIAAQRCAQEVLDLGVAFA